MASFKRLIWLTVSVGAVHGLVQGRNSMTERPGRGKLLTRLFVNIFDLNCHRPSHPGLSYVLSSKANPGS